MQLGTKSIRRNSDDYYIIAEAGVNHENDLDTAFRLIDLAKQGGADAIKFQTYKAESLACKKSPAYWDTNQEKTLSQFELFKKYDSFEEVDYVRLAEYAAGVGIDFMSTPFDLKSLEFINRIVSYHKIASADITNLPLLRAIGGTRKPVFISTGAATYLEVERAIDELQRAGATSVALLHCVLNYPTPPEKAFLARILDLSKYFPDYVIGYSDHTMPGEFCYPVVLAYALGARVIEKHFTFDKSLPGNDHYHAMDWKDLRLLRERLDEAKILLGARGQKDFISAQGSAIQNARRSIVSAGDLPAGTILDAAKLTVKRPGTGISPQHWDEVIGKKLRSAVADDTVLTWDMVHD